MFKIIKKISVLLVATLIIVATSGFSVHKHDCMCCETTNVSLVNINICCDVDLKNCDSELATSPCCSETLPIPKETETCSGADCCQIDHEFYKIENEFESQGSYHLKQRHFENHTIQIIKTEVLASDFVDKIIFISDKSPPKLAVNYFIIFSSSLKIPV